MSQGITLGCYCETGEIGLQTCQESGKDWSECDCTLIPGQTDTDADADGDTDADADGDSDGAHLRAPAPNEYSGCSPSEPPIRHFQRV